MSVTSQHITTQQAKGTKVEAFFLNSNQYLQNYIHVGQVCSRLLGHSLAKDLKSVACRLHTLHLLARWLERKHHLESISWAWQEAHLVGLDASSPCHVISVVVANRPSDLNA